MLMQTYTSVLPGRYRPIHHYYLADADLYISIIWQMQYLHSSTTWYMQTYASVLRGRCRPIQHYCLIDTDLYSSTTWQMQTPGLTHWPFSPQLWVQTGLRQRPVPVFTCWETLATIAKLATLAKLTTLATLAILTTILQFVCPLRFRMS